MVFPLVQFLGGVAVAVGAGGVGGAVWLAALAQRSWLRPSWPVLLWWVTSSVRSMATQWWLPWRRGGCRFGAPVVDLEAPLPGIGRAILPRHDGPNGVGSIGKLPGVVRARCRRSLYLRSQKAPSCRFERAAFPPLWTPTPGRILSPALTRRRGGGSACRGRGHAGRRGCSTRASGCGPRPPRRQHERLQPRTPNPRRGRPARRR
jgi:hypothetical protein